MIYRDPKCVFVANDGATANMIAGMLNSAGFPAEVMNEATLGGFEGITGLVPGYSQKGMEVWVIDLAQAEPAKKWLEEEAKAIEGDKARRAARTGTVTAVCEDCGKSSDWPANVMGTTETCPHCGNFMDVPDPDEDWSGVDFGTDDEENEAEGETK